MFMIPDDILETLICRKCKNYLSARPVKVYPNRHILCGRCSIEGDHGVVSIYDALAEQGLFKCINRYQGCDKLLRYTEVREHETTCKASQYKCPLCTNESLESLSFFHHFKEMHKSYILSSPTFQISKFSRKFSKHFLYATGNFLFLVITLLFRGLDGTLFICLNSVLLGPKSMSEKIYQKYTLHKLKDGKMQDKYVTRRKLCSPYGNKLKNKIVIGNYEVDRTENLVIDFELDIKNVQTLISMPSFQDLTRVDIIDIDTPGCSGIQNQKKSIKISITKEFERMWSSKYKLSKDGTFILSMNRKIGFCCHCQNLFLIQSENQGVYKCMCTQCTNSNNLLCSKCFFFGLILCINGNGKAYQFAVEETAVFKTVQYYCIWGCGECFYSWHIKLHELNCPSQNERLCPVDTCTTKLSGRELIQHIQNHPEVIYQDDNSILTNILNNENKNCIIIPALNYFIAITYDRILANTYSCSMFNTKNSNFGNHHPVACFNKSKRIVSCTDIFTVDVEDDHEILVILKVSNEASSSSF